VYQWRRAPGGRASRGRSRRRGGRNPWKLGRGRLWAALGAGADGDERGRWPGSRRSPRDCSACLTLLQRMVSPLSSRSTKPRNAMRPVATWRDPGHAPRPQPPCHLAVAGPAVDHFRYGQPHLHLYLGSPLCCSQAPAIGVPHDTDITHKGDARQTRKPADIARYVYL
jgi:hypothetical protein